VPDFAGTSAIGTWWPAQPRHVPVDSRGQVQPFGVRSTIIGQRGLVGTPLARACPWWARISATQWSSVAAIAWCMLAGSEPSTKYGVQPQP
jgi:hypothetical protein